MTMPDPFTRRLLAKQNRAAALFESGDDFLMRLAVDEMVERLAGVERHFDETLALFGRTEYLASQMENSPRVGAVKRLEVEGLANADNLELAPHSVDLILAPLTPHFMQDLPGGFAQMRQALRPDGLLLAMLPGPQTLQELRESFLVAESTIVGGAAQRVDAFTDIRDAGGLLQRTGYALPVLDSDTLTVRYDSMFKLIGDLRRFGASGHYSDKSVPPLNRDVVALAAQHYAENFADDDGRVRATFQLVSLSGWAPHESQQKPLKPGSAKIRLADALGVKEGGE